MTKANQYFQLCFLCFLFLCFANCNQKVTPVQVEKTDDYMITNVSIISMLSNEVTPPQNVFIRDGKIIGLGIKPNWEKRPNVIDGTGKFLMPGLTEMHAHIPIARRDGDSMVMETLFLYLSQGVTNIRGMLGDPYHLELRKLANEGSILSPRIYTSSPSMNGNSIPTPAEAIAKVTQYKNDGYDFLKIHPGIKIEVWDALEKTANEVKMPFAGHVPVEVGIRRALDSKYKTIDHLDGYLEGLVPASKNVDPTKNGFFGYDFTDLTDESLIDDLVTKTLANDVAVVPTQTLFSRWFSATPTEELVNAFEMQYISPKQRYTWLTSKTRFTDNENFSKEKWQRFFNIRKKLLQVMDKKGVTFLLGSDAPQVFNVPGFSIHHEMEEMANAGISNFKILQSGTTNPADFFGATGDYGIIKEGAAADLILLNGNPLEDIGQSKNIVGVMLGKRWLNRAFIDKELEKIAIRYQE